MADWAWRFSLRLTRRVIFSPGGPSTFRRSAWGDFSVGRGPRSWRARSNTSGCRSRRFGLALQFCEDVLPGNRVPKVTLQIATTVSRKDNWLVPPERDLRTLDSPATPPAPDRATWRLTARIHARTLNR